VALDAKGEDGEARVPVGIEIGAEPEPSEA
jgi:hypothetical protein